MNGKAIFRILLAVLAAIAGAAACGGGSEGTGGVTIEGTITTKEGEPLDNLEVIVEQTGNSDITGPNGGFSIRLPVRLLDDIILRFRRSDIDAHFVLHRLDQDTVLVEIVFEYDRQQRRVDAVRIDERTHDRRRPPSDRA